MTTLKSNDFSKTIKFAIPNTIREVARDICIIEAPFIACSNRKDAEFIQAKMGEYLGELVKKVLEDD